MNDTVNQRETSVPDPAKADAETENTVDAEAVFDEGIEILDGNAEETADPQAEIAALQAQLEESQQQAEAQRQGRLRAAAEMENLRKRNAREMDKARRFAVERFAKDLLSVMDNLERALSAMEETKGKKGNPLDALAEGVGMTRNELTRVLGQHGVTRVEALQKPFDPNLHQAMMQTPDASVEPDTVVLEMQAGYLLNDRLLRPAMVAVAVKG